MPRVLKPTQFEVEKFTNSQDNHNNQDRIIDRSMMRVG